MTETIPQPRREQSSSPDDLARDISASVEKDYEGYYRPGDRLECDYSRGAEGITDTCEVTFRPGGITRLIRTSDIGRQVGILRDGIPSRWLQAGAKGVGIPDGAEPEETARWMVEQLTQFKEEMLIPGALKITPVEERLAS